MIVEDLGPGTPQQELERDDEALRRADAGLAKEGLRFWESPCHCVILGRACDPAADVDLEAVARDRIPVLRRSSGGGTVLQGPGCLNFSLVLAKTRHADMAGILSSYRYVLGFILAALATLGIRAEFRPVCDLVLAEGEKKFSGNAQRRGRAFILHHGTLLYGLDLGLVARYLRLPARMPDYRGSRSHEDFVTNIPATPTALRAAIAEAFTSRLG